MPRYCLALDLKDDPALIAAYEAHHRAVWPEVLDSIRDSGILSMQIWRTGNRLFLIMETRDDFSFAAKSVLDASNARVRQWESLMDKFQLRLPWAAEGEKWVLMNEIFSFLPPSP